MGDSFVGEQILRFRKERCFTRKTWRGDRRRQPGRGRLDLLIAGRLGKGAFAAYGNGQKRLTEPRGGQYKTIKICRELLWEKGWRR